MEVLKYKLESFKRAFEHKYPFVVVNTSIDLQSGYMGQWLRVSVHKKDAQLHDFMTHVSLYIETQESIILNKYFENIEREIIKTCIYRAFNFPKD